jgi:hypothetical protein
MWSRKCRMLYLGKEHCFLVNRATSEKEKDRVNRVYHVVSYEKERPNNVTLILSYTRLFQHTQTKKIQ